MTKTIKQILEEIEAYKAQAMTGKVPDQPLELIGTDSLQLVYALQEAADIFKEALPGTPVPMDRVYRWLEKNGFKERS